MFTWRALLHSVMCEHVCSHVCLRASCLLISCSCGCSYTCRLFDVISRKSHSAAEEEISWLHSHRGPSEAAARSRRSSAARPIIMWADSDVQTDNKLISLLLLFLPFLRVWGFESSSVCARRLPGEGLFFSRQHVNDRPRVSLGHFAVTSVRIVSIEIYLWNNLRY